MLSRPPSTSRLLERRRARHFRRVGDAGPVAVGGGVCHRRIAECGVRTVRLVADRRSGAGRAVRVDPGLFAFGTYWLYTCLHVFGLVPIWLTVVLQAALIGLMSTYSAALCYLANRFWL